MDRMLESDIIILNAYSTLDGDESIWLTTLENFDEKLALDKFTMNTLGYVKLLQEFVKKRKEYITKHNLNKDILMVFMDANESLFEKKLMDGKHLELNLAKTATKQIFYTNANLLGSLGIITCCYNPGWLSWHGITVDKEESKTDKLISPEISAMSLLHILQNINVEEYIDNKKVIFDDSVYNVLNNMKI